MHIEFNLPTGAGGQSAYYFNTVLDYNLAQWSGQYSIKYTKTLTYYKAWIWLPTEQDNTMFALTCRWPTPRWILPERD